MTLDHSFYKILVVALGIYAVVAFLVMAQQVGLALSLIDRPIGYQSSLPVSALNSVGSFMLSLATLYFVPKFVRKHLMEEI